MPLNDFWQAILYSLIIFFLLVALARLMGKKLLSQMTFFDFVVGITMGTIGGSFVSTEAKGFYVLLSPVVLTLSLILLGYLTVKSVPVRKLIEGEPVIVIQNGKIYEDNMRKLRYHEDDLLMQLRDKGVFDPGEVEFAIMEPHGQLSVLKKSQNLPLTSKDLGLSSQYKGIPSEIIRDGKIVEQNLQQNRLSHEWLYNQLSSKKIDKIEDVFLATLDTAGNLYLDVRRDNPDYVQEIDDDDSVI